jgi:hypothetical protein
LFFKIFCISHRNLLCLLQNSFSALEKHLQQDQAWKITSNSPQQKTKGKYQVGKSPSSTPTLSAKSGFTTQKNSKFSTTLFHTFPNKTG